MATTPKDPLTTASGSPVAAQQDACTAGARGPLLVQDWQLFDTHAHGHRERLPERVLHATGAGA
jgi:catalase